MAEEDEGMEAFDFDERDLEFALNPGRRHYQTKNQATYGGNQCRQRFRKGRAAVGAYGKEAVGPKFGETAAEAQRRLSEQKQDAKVDDLSTPQLKNAWKKAAKVKELFFKEALVIVESSMLTYVKSITHDVQVKTRYKTIDEVIEEGGSIGFRSSVKTGVKVIDMTGPEQRVYSGYDSFSMKSRASFNDISDRDVFDVPELMHNLNLLVDLTEENIRRNDSQLKSIKDRTTALGYDLEQAKLILESESKEYERIKEVFDLIEK
ncbi:hypothetical protein OSTOST_14924 [Ostertagia ostertagi]